MTFNSFAPEMYGFRFWNAIACAEERQAEQKEANYAEKEFFDENLETETIEKIMKQTNEEFSVVKNALSKANNDSTEAIICILEKKDKHKEVRKDVQLVMDQTNCRRNQALQAILKNNFDLVDAITQVVAEEN